MNTTIVLMTISYDLPEEHRALNFLIP